MVDYGHLSQHYMRPLLLRVPNQSQPSSACGSRGTKLLVTLTANLSSIPTKQMPERTGADAQTYFYCNFEIRVTFHSAHTTYALWYDNKCYGAVDAEYA